jgi:hypothetical protein
MRTALLLAVVSIPAWPQALKLLGPLAKAGMPVPVELSLTSPKGQEPAALQWDLAYPAPLVGTEPGDLAIGAAAQSAGKTLSCQGHAVDAGTFEYRCILAGGRKRIEDGEVAVIQFHVRPTAAHRTATVRVKNAMGVLPDGKNVAIAPLQTDIAIE